MGQDGTLKYRAVLFDLDGTLVNTNDLVVSSFQHTFRENLGLEVAPEEIYPYFGEPLETTMARFSEARALELVKAYRTYMLAHHDTLIQQFEGVRDAVVALNHAGVRLAVVTSKKVSVAHRGLRVSGLSPFFETLVGMEDTEQHKPNPEPVLLAVERLGLEPGPQVLMVGDSRYDILCGRNAGVGTAAVGWSMQTRDSLAAAEPDFWVHEPADLVSLIL